MTVADRQAEAPSCGLNGCHRVIVPGREIDVLRSRL